jgi:phosphoribosyl 1,2-cyclic phosphodiesterase
MCPPDDGVWLCVLASGSGGNCSVLLTRRGSVSRVTLIDLGLSPKRTFQQLAILGIQPYQIDDAIVTHLDWDHFSTGWRSGLPKHARLRLHSRHVSKLGDRVPRHAAVVPFADPFDLCEGVRVEPHILSHDEDGVSALRMDFPGFGGGSLGFATDLGHVTADLVRHFGPSNGRASVDVLAIESNYCPAMQLASSRPAQLKARIMGGKGHLSNQQAAEAVEAIAPREHVVLLHLSRQCNTPGLASAAHEGADYALTISGQFEATRWVRVSPTTALMDLARRPARMSSQIAATATLWSAAAE